MATIGYTSKGSTSVFSSSANLFFFTRLGFEAADSLSIAEMSIVGGFYMAVDTEFQLSIYEKAPDANNYTLVSYTEKTGGIAPPYNEWRTAPMEVAGSTETGKTYILGGNKSGNMYIYADTMSGNSIVSVSRTFSLGPAASFSGYSTQFSNRILSLYATYETTPPQLPKVTTLPAINIGENQALFRGEVE